MVPARAAKSRVERVDDGLRARAGREGAVEAHGEEGALGFLPAPFADDEVAADVEEDVVEAGFEALLAKAAAVEFAETIEGGDEDGVGGGLDCGLDEIGGRRQRAERDDL